MSGKFFLVCYSLLQISNIFTMDSAKPLDKVIASEIYEFSQLPIELRSYITELTILEIVIKRENKNHLKEQIDKLRFINKDFYEILKKISNIKFISELAKRINNHELFAISEFTLAKCVLDKEAFNKYKASNIDKSKRLLQRSITWYHSGVPLPDAPNPDLYKLQEPNVIIQCIKQGIDLEQPLPKNETLLLCAITEGNSQLIRILIMAGADIDFLTNKCS